MATCPQPSVVLAFGGALLQVDSALATEGRRGALRSFAREAEQQFGLLPGMYSFVHSQGKVDSPAALESALQAPAVDGVCQLEICERAEGRMMRAMEERMVARMEKALAGMRKEVDTKLQESANVHFDLLSARMDEMSQEALASRMDAIAGEEELSKRLDGLAEECLAMREDSLLGEEALTTRLDKLLEEVPVARQEQSVPSVGVSGPADVADSFEMLQALEKELQQECEAQSERELNAMVEDDCEMLRKQVRSLDEMSFGAVKEVTAIAADIASCNTASVVNAEVARPLNLFRDPLDMSPWKNMAHMSIPYSGKAIPFPQGSSLKLPRHNGEKIDLGSPFSVDAIAPFAHRTSASRLRGCRSSPLLAPLR